MSGAARELRLSKAALFRLDDGGFPVCWVNLAFSVAMAAAASGNIALMVDGSSPECLLIPGVRGGCVREFLLPSTFNLPMASLRRFDIGSVRESQISGVNQLGNIFLLYLYQNWQGRARQTWDGSFPSAAVLE